MSNKEQSVSHNRQKIVGIILISFFYINVRLYLHSYVMKTTPSHPRLEYENKYIRHFYLYF